MRKLKQQPDETFNCRFSDGTSVSFAINLKTLRRAIDSSIASIPQPPVKKELLPEYINWMHTVMSTLARRLGRSIPYCYPSTPPEEPVFYLYRPDGSYEVIAEG